MYKGPWYWAGADNWFDLLGPRYRFMAILLSVLLFSGLVVFIFVVERTDYQDPHCVRLGDYIELGYKDQDPVVSYVRSVPDGAGNVILTGADIYLDVSDYLEDSVPVSYDQYTLGTPFAMFEDRACKDLLLKMKLEE